MVLLELYICYCRAGLLLSEAATSGGMKEWNAQLLSTVGILAPYIGGGKVLMRVETRGR